MTDAAPRVASARFVAREERGRPALDVVKKPGFFFNFSAEAPNHGGRAGEEGDRDGQGPAR